MGLNTRIKKNEGVAANLQVRLQGAFGKRALKRGRVRSPNGPLKIADPELIDHIQRAGVVIYEKRVPF
jgi:hypothetical protein